MLVGSRLRTGISNENIPHAVGGHLRLKQGVELVIIDGLHIHGVARSLFPAFLKGLNIGYLHMRGL